MKKFVIDSSILVKFISKEKEEHLNRADLVLQDLKKGKIELLTSNLALFEIGNALWKKRIDPSGAGKGLATFLKLPIEIREADLSLLAIAYKIGYQYKITFYDSVFIALAIKEKCLLLTANPKHQQKFKSVKVVRLTDYK